jgi:hypothetical protein
LEADISSARALADVRGREVERLETEAARLRRRIPLDQLSEVDRAELGAEIEREVLVERQGFAQGERAAAETIASWLEQRYEGDSPRLKQLADQLRSGAWRKEQP